MLVAPLTWLGEAMVTSESLTERQTARTVVTCYSVFHRIFPRCGLFDLTEGIYAGQDHVPYEQAQAAQCSYLLDQLGCGRGSRLLDIGCGYGRMLHRAQQRGARAVGITVSPEQVRHGKRVGLDVRLCDYRALGPEWNAAFDGVVANGSLEHFVQPADVLSRQADEIYRHFFQTVHRLLKPDGPGRLVTTVIHFVRRPEPQDLIGNPFRFARGSDAFHFSLLAHSFGGWYPVAGQLARCAQGCFKLVSEVDGTDDYHRTSEDWLRQVQRELKHSPLGLTLAALPGLVRHPRQTALMLYCLLVSQSWNWQFRSPQPPTRLLRQTWQRVTQRAARHDLPSYAATA